MWEMAKALREPLDTKLKQLPDIPYTISFVIRKRIQVDNFNELPKDKRPSDKMIWDGSPEEIESWLDRVFKGKEQTNSEIVFSESEIE
jgi:hypothetical protein